MTVLVTSPERPSFPVLKGSMLYKFILLISSVTRFDYFLHVGLLFKDFGDHFLLG